MRKAFVFIKKVFLQQLKRMDAMSLSKKIIWSYSLLIFVPLMGGIVLIGSYTMDSLEDKTYNIVKQNIKQSAEYCSYLFREIENSCMNIRSDWADIDYEHENEVYQRYMFDKALENLDDQLYLYEIYDKMKLFVSEKNLIPNISNKVYDMAIIQSETVYGEILNSPTRGIWTSSDRIGLKDDLGRMVYCVMMEKPFDNSGVDGLMVLYFLDLEFNQILNTMASKEKEYAYIVDNEGTVLMTSSGLKSNAIEIMDLMDKEHGFKITEAIGDSGLTMVYITDESVLFKEIRDQQYLLLVIVFILFVIAMMISVMISRTTTFGINRLIDDMKRTVLKMKTDDPICFEPIDPKSRNEVTRLNRHYQEMVVDIKNAHDKNIAIEREKKAAELRALQMQIKPHFLYNILDSINWLSLRYKAYDISDIVTKLGDFYRYNLSGGKDIITLGEELELLKIYVELQQVRFRDSIDAQYDVQEDLLELPICKMTLQPLAENAIYHGIMSKTEKKGQLKVLIYQKDDTCIIELMDDAGKMDTVAMARALVDDTQRDKSNNGYGIYNVNERLTLYFQKDTCLNFKVAGGWSKAIVRIPAK